MYRMISLLAVISLGFTFTHGHSVAQGYRAGAAGSFAERLSRMETRLKTAEDGKALALDAYHAERQAHMQERRLIDKETAALIADLAERARNAEARAAEAEAGKALALEAYFAARDPAPFVTAEVHSPIVVAGATAE